MTKLCSPEIFVRSHDHLPNAVVVTIDGEDFEMSSLSAVRPPAPEPYTVCRARFVCPLDPECPTKIIEDGYVLTEGSHILEVGHWTSEVANRLRTLPNLRVLGAIDHPQDGLIMPAFTKAHGHDLESIIVGYHKESSLTEWLDAAVNLQSAFLADHGGSEAVRARLGGRTAAEVICLRSVLEDVQFGIVNVLTHHCSQAKYYIGPLVAANEAAGTRRMLAVGQVDRNYDPVCIEPVERALKRLEAARKLYGPSSPHHAHRTTFCPGPDQIFSNSAESLRALKQWAREHGTVLHIHSSEEPGTTRWFRETYGQTPVEYADSIGVMDDHTVVAHQVNCTKHDLEILAARGVKVAHNPLANTILGSGMPPIPEMMHLGIPVAISTDGSGSADSQNMVQAMHLTAAYFRARDCNAHLFSAAQAIEMATAVPASFYGWNSGRLVPGMDADFIMMDLRAPNLCPSNARTVLNNVLWAASGAEVRHVVGQGVVLKEDYEFKTLDKNRICRDIQELQDIFFEWLDREKPSPKMAAGARAAGQQQ